MSARPFLWAKTIWNMFDFAMDTRNEGGQPGVNDKGMITGDRRIRKDAFYYYKANWNETGPRFVYITSRRWLVRDEAATTVKIYSNCDQVELAVNGISQGARTGSADHIFTWDVMLPPGISTVAATARGPAGVIGDLVNWEVRK